MKKSIVLTLFAVLLSFAQIISARTWKEMPGYQKGYEKLYGKSSRQAALEWFKDARFGLFIHWAPDSLYACDS